MDTSTVVFLVIAIVAVVAVAFVLRTNLQASNKKVAAGEVKKRSTDKARPTAKGRYRATSITCGDNACAAVQAFKDKRFLVADNDIPQLPVPNCDAKKCTCVYSHHKDRREEGEDRRGPRGLRTDLHSYAMDSERRVRRGRRKSDWE